MLDLTFVHLLSKPLHAPNLQIRRHLPFSYFGTRSSPQQLDVALHAPNLEHMRIVRGEHEREVARSKVARVAFDSAVGLHRVEFDFAAGALARLGEVARVEEPRDGELCGVLLGEALLFLLFALCCGPSRMRHRSRCCCACGAQRSPGGGACTSVRCRRAKSSCRSSS